MNSYYNKKAIKSTIKPRQKLKKMKSIINKS